MLCGDLNGKEIPKRGEFIHPSIYLPFYIFTHIYRIHFDVQQKLTTLRISLDNKKKICKERLSLSDMGQFYKYKDIEDIILIVR